MPLKMAEFPIREIRFGPRFGYRDGVLDVDRDALIELVLRDSRIQSARFEIVAPGDAVRVTGIRDVVEPRFKVGDSGQVFPGVLGPVTRVGQGLTHRLSGMAVVGCAAYGEPSAPVQASSAVPFSICLAPALRRRASAF
jgi:glycine reductase